MSRAILVTGGAGFIGSNFIRHVLAAHPEPLGLKQVAQYTGLHPSTAHRILSAMASDRLIDRIEPGSYRLGMRLLELGNLVKMRINVREMALPVYGLTMARSGPDPGT